jgi:exosome complex RNA-binding protein Rrp42 (RNase PH superfamily)
MTARITVAVNGKGDVCGMQKSGPVTLPKPTKPTPSNQGSVSTETLGEMLKCAQQTAKSLIVKLAAVTKRSTQTAFTTKKTEPEEEKGEDAMDEDEDIR